MVRPKSFSIYRCLFFILFLNLLANTGLAQTAPSPYVKVNGRQLVADFTGNGNYQPYIIRGVAYSPTPIGRYPSDWGYYVSQSNPNPNNLPNNMFADTNILSRDFALMRQMNANTIRIWSGSDNLECGVSNINFENAFPNQPSSYGDNIFSWLRLNNYVDVDGLVTVNLASSSFLDALQAQFMDQGESAIILSVLQNAVNSYSSSACGRIPNMLTTTTLATASNYGLHVIAGFYIPCIGSIYNSDSTDPNFNAPFDPTNTYMANDILARFKNYIATFKNRPEILFWAIGNENNLYLDPNNTAQIKAWYSLVNQLAGAAHQIEGANYHPVAVVNGDLGYIGDQTVGADDQSLSNVDIWGTNTYRGQSFKDYFVQYKSLSTKPLWISEYGIDAFQSCDTTQTGCDPNNPSGTEDQADQASWDGGLWDEIAGNADIAIGATVMEYSDEWWKPYDWLCTSLPYIDETPYPSDPSLAANYCHSTHLNFGEGPGSSWKSITAPTPDHYFNEEWWGLMAISNSNPEYGLDTMTPRQAYYTLQGKFLSSVNNAALPSYLESPAAGTVLNSNSYTFAWSLGRGVTQYAISIGSSPGASDIYQNSGTSTTTAAVSNIPLGQPIYVQLGSMINGSWQYNNYTYQTNNTSNVFTINCTAGPNGSCTPPTATVSLGGISPIFTITPNPGYVITSVTLNGVAQDFLPSGLTIFFAIVTQNYNVVATFGPNPFNSTPAVPTNLSGTGVSSSQINLNWTASSGATGYNIYRNGTKVATSSNAFYSDTGLQPSTTYSYTVSAYNTVGTSAQTTAISVATSSNTISPDGSTLSVPSTGNLVTSAGTWTFGSLMDSYGSRIILNGQPASSGFAQMLLVYNKGQMYAETKISTWYQWNGSSWVSISGDPRTTTVPPVPTGLTATVISSSQINLSWGPSSGATSYVVYRNGAQVGTSTSASYSDTGLLASTTYSYTVSASNSFGSSAQSSAVSATTQAAAANSPDGSTLSAGSSGSLVTSAGTWTFASLMDSFGSKILLNGQSASNGYAQLLLVYNQGKMYAQTKVSTWYLWSSSGWTAISGDPRPGVLPAVPTGLAATDISFSQINLVWYASSNATGYDIYRNGTKVGTSTNLSYLDTGLTASTTYTYTVAAYNANGTSAQSSPVSASTSSSTVSPDGSILLATSTGDLVTSAGTWTFSQTYFINGSNAILLNGQSSGGSGILLLVYNQGHMYAQAKNNSWWMWNGSAWVSIPSDPRVTITAPTDLMTTVISSSQINLSWIASTGTNGIAGYKIFRNGTQVGTSTGLTYSDTGLTISTAYSYTVSAYDAAGNSSVQSSAVSATTSSTQTNSPDGTTLNINSSGSLVTSAGTWTFAGNLSNNNGDAIVLNGYQAGGGYGVLLLVYNQGHIYAQTRSGTWWLWSGSTWTATIDPRVTPTPPSVPTNLTATAVSSTKVNLTWTASSGTVLGYNIYRNATLVGTSTLPSYSDTGLSAQTMYSYTIAAYNPSNTSAQSTAVSVTTPQAPTVSPDGSTLTVGSSGNLVTSYGTWTFSSQVGPNGNYILLNGNSADGGNAKMLLVYNQGKMYAETNSGTWWLWNGIGWSSVSADPR